MAIDECRSSSAAPLCGRLGSIDTCVDVWLVVVPLLSVEFVVDWFAMTESSELWIKVVGICIEELVIKLEEMFMDVIVGTIVVVWLDDEFVVDKFWIFNDFDTNSLGCISSQLTYWTMNSRSINIKNFKNWIIFDDDDGHNVGHRLIRNGFIIITRITWYNQIGIMLILSSIIIIDVLGANWNE